MPIYVYDCEKCDTKKEKIETFDAPTDQPCETEDCDGTMKRTFDISGGSFELKGGGWGEDGYHNYTYEELFEETGKQGTPED